MLRSKCLSMVLLLGVVTVLFAPINSYAWWSAEDGDPVPGISLGLGWSPSTHKAISDEAFSLLINQSKIKSSYLINQRSNISEYTTHIYYDQQAHGNNPNRNGGDIDSYFKLFKVAFDHNSIDAANIYLARCMHLIADMNVPAHAYNIPHILFVTENGTDNFEKVADFNLSFSPPTINNPSSTYINNPALYYAAARDNTKNNVNSYGFSNYWHAGTGAPWCGGWVVSNCSDGPAGYYTNPVANDDIDIFPSSFILMNPQAKNLLQKQLDEAVNYTAMFLVAVDKYINLPNLTPTLGTLTPSVVTSAPNVAKTFSAVYSDGNGYANLKWAYLLISTSGNGVNAIYVIYDRAGNKLYLRNDANTGYVGSCTPGVAGTLTNIQGTLNCGTTTVSGSGNNLTVNYNITPKSAFASATKKNLYMYASDNASATVGWTDKGDWTITVQQPDPGCEGGCEGIP